MRFCCIANIQINEPKCNYAEKLINVEKFHSIISIVSARFPTKFIDTNKHNSIKHINHFQLIRALSWYYLCNVVSVFGEAVSPKSECDYVK